MQSTNCGINKSEPARGPYPVKRTIFMPDGLFPGRSHVTFATEMKKQNAITELSYWKVLRTLLFIIFGSPIIYGSIQYVLFMIGGGVGKIVATFIMTWPWIAYFALPVIVFGDHFFKDGKSYTVTPIGLLLTTLLYLLISIVIAFPIRNRINKKITERTSGLSLPGTTPVD
jgi:hypothetical protein